MSIYIGNKKVSGNAKVSSLPLFTPQWQDHIINDASWLRSDTFSWQSGAVYISAYNHLVNDLIISVETLYCWNRPDKEVYTTKENPSIGDNVYIINNGIVEFASTINNISGNTIYPSNMQAYTRYSSGDINNQEVPITAETETIAGTTITFKRATDGHKIVDDTQVSNVEAIYNATGVAWYYVLDTTNTRFKLPRSKYNFVGLRDTVGNYVAESLPNITGKINGSSLICNNGATGEGAITLGSKGVAAVGGSGVPFFHGTLSISASDSSSVYQDNAPVQQRATQMYLYFYVGNTVVNETLVDVGKITDALNGKVDLPTNKTQADVDFVVESYQSGTSWYRVYKSGWCEQGGYVNNNPDYVEVTFLKQFADTNYSIQATAEFDSGFTPTAWVLPSNKSTTSVRIAAQRWQNASYAALVGDFYWRAEGYIA